MLIQIFILLEHTIYNKDHCSSYLPLASCYQDAKLFVLTIYEMLNMGSFFSDFPFYIYQLIG